MTKTFININIINRIIIPIIFIFSVKSATSQISEHSIKSALICNIANNISWQNESDIQQYNMAILSPDSVLFKRIKRISCLNKFKGKQLNVYLIKSIDKIKPNTHIIFCSRYYIDLLKNYNRQKHNNTLLITEACNDDNLYMVNLYKDNKTNKLLYKVSQNNIKSGNLSCSDDLLIWGGSHLDIRELYMKTNSKLNNKIQDYNNLQSQLEQTQLEKDSIRQEQQALLTNIRILLYKIAQKENELSELNSNIRSKDKMLSNAETKLKNKETLLINASDESKKLEQQIVLAEGKLNQLDSLIEENRQYINIQENLIKKKENLITLTQQRIKLQRIIVLVSIALLVLSVIAISFYLKAYRIKNRSNKKLEKLVAEKTDELQQSQAYFESLFGNSPIALLELDLAGVYEYITSLDLSLEEVFEKLQTDKELIKITAEKIVLRNLNNLAIKLFRLENVENKNKFFFDYTIEHYNDVYLQYKLMVLEKVKYSVYESSRNITDTETVHVKINWILLEENNVYSNVLIAIQDISELKQYQQELTNHKEHLEDIVVQRTEQIQQLNEQLFAQNQNLMANNQQLETQQDQIKLLNKKLIKTNTNLQIQKDQLKETIDELKNTQNQLVQSDKMASLGLLTAGIAHELNNPINFINAGNQVLKALFAKVLPILEMQTKIANNTITDAELSDMRKNINYAELIESIKTVLTNMDTGVERTSKIIKGLTTYSRKNDDVYQKYDIKKAIKNTLIILQNEYKNRITLIEQYHSDNVINCIAGKIDQVFMNIISNAIDSIEGKGTIKILTTVNKNNLVVTIEDSGKGISKENKAKIFDPFFTTKKVGKGVGLGLYISYGIIQKHKGKIKVDSELKKGTKFTIELPLNA